MKSFRKVIATTALVVVGSMSVATMASAESINGSGATFPQTFQAKATVDYSIATGHTVTYANPGGGSSTGKTAFFTNLTDFGGTDSAESAGSRNTAFGWVYVPYVAGATAVAYRLDELKGSTLNLSIPTVAGIFDGTIKTWNDPKIVADMALAPIWENSTTKSKFKGASALWVETSTTASTVTVTLNPAALKAAKGKKIEVFEDNAKKAAKSVTVAKKGQIAIALTTKVATYTVKVDGKEVAKFAQVDKTPVLPAKPITVVYRSDGSGTTNNFIKPLNALSTAWTVNDNFTTAIPGGSATIAGLGAAFQGQSGSANVSNAIADTNGSIGYTEISFVTDATRAAKGMLAANIKNVAGKFVAPTAAATSSMIADSDIDAKGFVTFNYKQTTNTTAYPFVAITYVLARTAPSSKATIVADYLKWILNSFAPLQAEALGYAPLTGAVLTIAKNNAARVGTGN
jgi:ABC-type phosphate transport system substrate-binding protein